MAINNKIEWILKRTFWILLIIKNETQSLEGWKGERQKMSSLYFLSLSLKYLKFLC